MYPNNVPKQIAMVLKIGLAIGSDKKIIHKILFINYEVKIVGMDNV